MTATTLPAGFLSTEAARGARDAKLAEIDRDYEALISTFDDEHQQERTAAITASCTRIKKITAGMDLESWTSADHASQLQRWFSLRKLFNEASEMDERLARLERVHHLNVSEVEEQWARARNAYDFSVPMLVSAPAEVTA